VAPLPLRLRHGEDDDDPVLRGRAARGEDPPVADLEQLAGVLRKGISRCALAALGLHDPATLEA
jgi:hypothetical protein